MITKQRIKEMQKEWSVDHSLYPDLNIYNDEPANVARAIIEKHGLPYQVFETLDGNYFIIEV